MHHYLNEHDITLQRIQTILLNAGWPVDVIDDKALRITTNRGLRLRLFIDPTRRFFDLDTYLPLRLDYTDGSTIANALNQDELFPSMGVDAENDLGITYSISRERGVIVPQFLSLVLRFAELVDRVVERYATHDHGRSIFDFKRNRPTTDDPGL